MRRDRPMRPSARPMKPAAKSRTPSARPSKTRGVRSNRPRAQAAANRAGGAGGNGEPSGARRPGDGSRRPPPSASGALKRCWLDPDFDRRQLDAGSQKALDQFNKNAGTNFDVKLASLDALDAVRAKTSRVCPLFAARASGPKAIAVCRSLARAASCSVRWRLPREARAGAARPHVGKHRVVVAAAANASRSTASASANICRAAWWRPAPLGFAATIRTGENLMMWLRCLWPSRLLRRNRTRPAARAHDYPTKPIRLIIRPPPAA